MIESLSAVQLRDPVPGVFSAEMMVSLFPLTRHAVH